MMKRILIFLFCLSSLSAVAQLGPNLHTVINKPIVISTTSGGPLDAVSMYYDAPNFLYRDYQSLAEARTYLAATKWRVGNHIIYIHSGGTLNSNGTYTGGSTQFYLWANGTTDNALIPLFDFISSGFLSVNTNPVDSNYQLTINVNGKLRYDTNLVWNPVSKQLYSFGGEIDFASGIFNHTRAIVSASVPNLSATVTDSSAAMNVREHYRRPPPGGGGGISSAAQYYTTGPSYTITSSAAQTIVLYVNPATTLTTSTITFPATAVDQQEIEIHFGGTITAGDVVTALTLNGNTKSIVQNTIPTNVEAYETIIYRYNSSNNTYYRKY